MIIIIITKTETIVIDSHNKKKDLFFLMRAWETQKTISKISEQMSVE